MNPWGLSDRADPASCTIADRHYSRQKPGTPQFVPPGRCVVLRTPDAPCLWVTSWPFAEFTKQEWAGAWVSSLFRSEAPDRYLSSDLVTAAVAATRAVWDPPPLGIVTFIDTAKTRRKRDPGRCYRRAGWQVAGETKGGLVALQQLPADMPDPDPAIGSQMMLGQAT